MGDSRFYDPAGPFSVKELAEFGLAELNNSDLAERMIQDVASLGLANGFDVAFFDNPKYAKLIGTTKAGALILSERFQSEAPSNTALLISESPYKSYALIAQHFYPPSAKIDEIDAKSFVHPSAKVGERTVIGRGAVIEEEVEIGDDCSIGGNTFIGRGVQIGARTQIGTVASIIYSKIGTDCIIHSGARIGQEGFGFVPDAELHIKVPQTGLVIIEDHVEIGANTCVDRGSLENTEIGHGTKIDNLVHIAHNVKIGKGCFVAGLAGIAGSSTIGEHVMVGGQAGIAGHIKIGDDVKIAAQTGVTKDIAAGETVVGFPAANAKKYWKNLARLNRLSVKDD